jgi:hypothetical protein
MTKKPIALIFVAFIVGSTLLSGIVSAALPTRDIAVKAVVEEGGNRIRISVFDNNHPGAVSGVNIQVIDVTTRKSLMVQKVKGQLANSYYCDIDSKKLASGENKIHIGALGISDSSSDSNKRNNWMYVTIIKKQDVTMTNLETREVGGKYFVQATFKFNNRDPKGGDLWIGQNFRHAIYQQHYSSKDVIGKGKISTAWIEVDLTKGRNADVFGAGFEPTFGDSNPKDNYREAIISHG